MLELIERINLLKSEMIKNGWMVEPFLFKYNNVNCVVLVKRYTENEEKVKNSIIKLEFYKEDNRCLYADVKKYGIYFESAKAFRIFFNIRYVENIGDIFKQFKEYFIKFIPVKINENKTEKEKIIMVKSLSESDSEDPNKIYCFGVKRTGNRSPFNDNKARLLRPKLYNDINDNTVSFCFSSDREKEKGDVEILANWAKNKSNIK